MAKQTYTTTTTGGAWTTLVSGECTVASLIVNATTETTLLSLRVTLANGTFSYILPVNTLPYNSPNRLAIGGISLKAGDKLEALSVSPADWVTTVVTGISYTSGVVTSVAGDVWTTLVTGPRTVRGIFVSCAAVGTVGIRIKKASTEASIVLSEELKSGGSKRLMIPLVLGAGETLQVRGSTPASWIATGIETT